LPGTAGLAGTSHFGGEEKQVMKLEREEGLGIDPKVEHRLIR
jgi:hypothetical protein